MKHNGARRVSFVECVCGPQMADAIPAVHYHRAQQNDGFYRRLPPPSATLIITLGGQSVWRPTDGAWRPFPALALRGPATVWSLGKDEESAAVEYMIVFVEPWAIESLFGIRAEDTLDGIIDLGALWGRRAELLLDEIASVVLPQQKIAAVVSWLRGAVENLTSDPLGKWFVDACRSKAGNCNIAAEAAEAGMSERWFRQRIQSAVGVGPKRWSLVERFAANLRSLHANPWYFDKVAALPAYFDNSHRIREFRMLAGMTPEQYRGGTHRKDRRLFIAPADLPESKLEDSGSCSYRDSADQITRFAHGLVFSR